MPSLWWAMISPISCPECARCTWPVLQRCLPICSQRAQPQAFLPSLSQSKHFYFYFFHILSLLLQFHLIKHSLCRSAGYLLSLSCRPTLAGWRRGEQRAECPGRFIQIYLERLLLLCPLCSLVPGRVVTHGDICWFAAPNLLMACSLEAEVGQAVKLRTQKGWNYHLQLHPNR